MAKSRVKVPATANADEVIEIKSLISHPMNSGRAKDKDGKTIPRKIINTFRVEFNGEEVLRVEIEPSVSANPFFSFLFKVRESGEFNFIWEEDGGGAFTQAKSIEVVEA